MFILWLLLYFVSSFSFRSTVIFVDNRIVNIPLSTWGCMCQYLQSENHMNSLYSNLYSWRCGRPTFIAKWTICFKSNLTHSNSSLWSKDQVISNGNILLNLHPCFMRIFIVVLSRRKEAVCTVSFVLIPQQCPKMDPFSSRWFRDMLIFGL
jgi:hypothetical protein